jgi:hypothetical protein
MLKLQKRSMCELQSYVITDRAKKHLSPKIQMLDLLHETIY